MTNTRAVLGTVLNRDDMAVVRLSAQPVAANTTIVKGQLVYMDGTNGWKPAPIDGSIKGRAMYFAETGGVSVALGDALIDVWKNNAIVIGKAQGAIVVGRSCKASETTAGSFMENTTPTAPGATYSQTYAQSLVDYSLKECATYVGHLDEFIEGNNLPTDAADAETDCVFVMTR